MKISLNKPEPNIMIDMSMTELRTLAQYLDAQDKSNGMLSEMKRIKKHIVHACTIAETRYAPDSYSVPEIQELSFNSREIRELTMAEKETRNRELMKALAALDFGPVMGHDRTRKPDLDESDDQ